MPAWRAKHRADFVIVEYAGNGMNLYNKYYQAPFSWILKYTPRDNKSARAEGQTPKLERGEVFLPNNAPWLDTFLHEVAEFPHGKYDDQVDSMVQFLWALDAGRGSHAFRDLSRYRG